MINKETNAEAFVAKQRLLATDNQFNARKSGAVCSSLSKSKTTKRLQVESIESGIFNFV